MTIGRRLTLWFGGILLVSLGIMAAVLHHEWVEQLRRSRDPQSKPEPAWEEVAEVVFYFGVPTALILLLGSWWLLRKSLAPVIALTHAAESIGIDNLKQRLPQSGNGDELDRLTTVLNSMMTRLDDSFTHIREFTLHASHELKTPLTVLRAEIETALRDPVTPEAQRDMMANHLDEIARLTKIVDSLTLLAKADAGQLNMAREPVRLDVLVRDSFADAQLLAQPGRKCVELQACDETIIQGDRHRLRQLLLNLTDNAIKYTQPEGHITLALSRRNGSARLTIANTGPGIAPELLPRVFQRFFRGDLSHNNEVEGCGLGLSIAQWIVQAHGGDIQVTSDVGHLTTVSVQLPLGSGA